ncbi:type IV fimbrial biogenesis protein [Oryzomicrobium terrae]|uniref:Type IV fimbrial biogenesis protein n=1 Tax=Oryzomicrobium terrae TaxID=1735038 RepID=A0A5C1EBJ4_9RHOO|nr:GspE/PulE family protein [Oryzomicrobium terrae]QEL65959.1 type IV fimbrial biogenesis protein [Oryzomicrobium terrae]
MSEATKRPLGQLLKEAEVVNEETLAYALKVQATSGTRLGETLQQLKFVTDQEIAQVLAHQFEVPFTELDEPLVPEVLRLLPFNFAQRHLMLPLAVEGGTAVLAVEDPGNPQLGALLARFVSQPHRLKVAPKGRLVREIQRRYYRAEHPLDAEIERMSQTIAAGRDFPAERLAELLLSAAIDARASDLHISPTPLATLVSLRLDGVLQLTYTLPASAHGRLVSTVKVMSGLDIADMNRAQDGRMSFPYLEEKFDLRISTMPGVNGENLVIRVLAGNNELYSLSSIGFDDAQIARLDRMIRRSHGAILVTGPTGAGKTTSLYGMLRRINMLQRNVLTIEDPVEFRIPLARQMEVNEKAGITFSSAVRAFLRQDPDVILVGEVRDEDTAQLAMRASQTGHLVLSTLHTNDAIGAIVRLRDLAVDDMVLSASLIGVVAQRLVRRLCPHCKTEVAIQDDDLARYGALPPHVAHHQGCARCHFTGYAGRAAIAEVIEFDEELRSLVERGAMPTEVERRAREKGMKSLREAALSLVRSGVTDLTEIERVL